MRASACRAPRRRSGSVAPHARSRTGSTDGTGWLRSSARSFAFNGDLMARTLKIGAREIGDHTPCYIIAEIGHNHQGNLDKARELFREAKLAGAHAVKLQKRDNRGLYTRAAYEKPYDNENSF